MKRSLLFLFIAPMALAQSFFADPVGTKSPTQPLESQMLSIRVVIGEPIKIFVVGREEAVLDWSSLELSVRRLNPFPQDLAVERRESYFMVPAQSTADLEVTAKANGQQEKLRVRVGSIEK